MKNSEIYSFNTNERTDLADFNCHWWYGATVNAHSHDDYYEISLVTEGEVINRINNENFKQGVGDVIVIKPGVSHRILNNKNAFSKHYNIVVKKRFFESFIQNKTPVNLKLKENNAIFIHLNDNAYNYVIEVISSIDNTNYDSLSYTLVQTALYTIISSIMLNEQSFEQNSTKISHYCSDAITKINNYSYITMQATEIYKLYPVSHTAFIAEFKKITGKTLISFLQSKKLDYAKTLLLTTDYSVLEIASLLNYDSLSYFIRIFKDEYKMTPFKYRKNNVGEIKEPR